MNANEIEISTAFIEYCRLMNEYKRLEELVANETGLFIER